MAPGHVSLVVQAQCHVSPAAGLVVGALKPSLGRYSIILEQAVEGRLRSLREFRERYLASLILQARFVASFLCASSTEVFSSMCGRMVPSGPVVSRARADRSAVVSPPTGARLGQLQRPRACLRCHVFVVSAQRCRRTASRLVRKDSTVRVRLCFVVSRGSVPCDAVPCRVMPCGGVAPHSGCLDL